MVVKVELLYDPSGLFWGQDGLKKGDVVDVPDDDAVVMLQDGRAKKVKEKKTEEKAVAPEESETAAVESEDAGPPAQSAVKADWVAYAVSQGQDEADAESWTKQELIDYYTQ